MNQKEPSIIQQAFKSFQTFHQTEDKQKDEEREGAVLEQPNSLHFIKPKRQILDLV